MLYRLTEIGIEIPIKDRVLTVLADLQGLAPSYGLIILIGLSIAFFISALLLKRFQLNSVLLYSVSGVVAVTTILIAMQPLLNVTLLASARDISGFIMQCVAGGLGGLLFGALRYQRIPQA